MFGFNIDGMFLPREEKDRLISLYKYHGAPKVVVILNDINFAIEFKQNFPTTEIVFRRTWGNEFDNLWKTTTPEQTIEIYRDAIQNDFIIYGLNEPSLQRETFDWSFRFGQLLLENNARGVLLNWSVGSLPIDDNINDTWAHILSLIGENRGRLFLGVHEYFFGHPFIEWTDEKLSSMRNFNVPDTTYIMGRYRKVLNYCERKDIPKPGIILTEYGWDDIRALYHLKDKLPNYEYPYRLPVVVNSLTQWAFNNGMSWEDYSVELFKIVHDKFYRYSEDVLGICFFSYGGVGAWNTMSIHHYPNLVQKLLQENFDTMYKEESEEDMKLGKLIKRVVYKSDFKLSYREQPNVAGKRIMLLEKGMVGYVFEEPLYEANGYTWKAGIFVNPLDGFYYAGFFASSYPNVIMEEVTEGDPVNGHFISTEDLNTIITNLNDIDDVLDSISLGE